MRADVSRREPAAAKQEGARGGAAMIGRPDGAGIYSALDTQDAGRAESWAEALAPHVGCLKLGLEFFVANGPGAVARIARHRPVFLDLKFHDIPNTVAGAVRSACALRP